jgi:poly(A) polymerase
MVEPLILPRSEHPISRRSIDPDALKVLYRLHQHQHVAYLVGGSVRDLLLGRTPKDFDIGTSAHPYEVKRLFRNCWIIGRRFRLAHVKFGRKTIEVATFRRKVLAGEDDTALEGPETPRDRLIHRDNTFGTPEEDAFRRDFTVNALFYDIATFAVIDYIGGLSDLRDRVIRSIGHPAERFQEDPVRMVRATALAARLDFTLDPPVLDAIASHRGSIVRSAPARLLEECYKILRSGAAEGTFRRLAETGLLAEISPRLDRVWDSIAPSLARLDAYRGRFDTAPEALTTPILLGSLLRPVGLSDRRPSAEDAETPVAATNGLGALPIARRDLDQLRHILTLQSRLLDSSASERSARGLLYRPGFRDALTWLDIHGEAPDAVTAWRERLETWEREPERRPVAQPRRRRRRKRLSRRTSELRPRPHTDE